MKAIWHNVKQLLIAIDQLLNVFVSIFFGELAWADETFSSHCYRWYRDGVRRYPMLIVDKLMFWDDGHCEESYVSEQERNQLPPELRGGL